MREKRAQGPPLSEVPAPQCTDPGLLLRESVHPVEVSTPGL